jgi:hypothetical protein
VLCATAGAAELLPDGSHVSVVSSSILRNFGHNALDIGIVVRSFAVSAVCLGCPRICSHVQPKQQTCKSLFCPSFRRQAELKMQTDSGRQFVTLFGLLQAILVILFVIFVEYDETVDGSTTDPEEPVQSIYPSFQDVHVMIFIGFGFLMTFLRKYLYGAVGFTFMIAAFCIQWAILNNEFWNKVVHNEVHEKIFIDIAK